MASHSLPPGHIWNPTVTDDIETWWQISSRDFYNMLYSQITSSKEPRNEYDPNSEHRYRPSKPYDEERCYPLLDKEENGVQEPDIQGLLGYNDVSWPTPTNLVPSNGYCTAEVDHSYSTTRPREPSTADSGSVDFFGMNISTTDDMLPDMRTSTDMTNSPREPSVRNREIKIGNVNLEELIDDWLNADSSLTDTISTITTNRPQLSHASSNQNHHRIEFTNNEIMDIEQRNNYTIGNKIVNENILLNMLNESEINGGNTPYTVCNTDKQPSGDSAIQENFGGLIQQNSYAPNCSSLLLRKQGVMKPNLTISKKHSVLPEAPFPVFYSCIPENVNTTVSAKTPSFPSGAMCITNEDCDNLAESSQDLSMEHTNQQIGDVLANYLRDSDPLWLQSENYDTSTGAMNDKPFTGVLNDIDLRIEPLTSTVASITTAKPSASTRYFSSLPAASRSDFNEEINSKHSTSKPYSGLDDNRNSSRLKKAIGNNEIKTQMVPPTVNRECLQPTVLEKFLLTKQSLNPNKGSEAALVADSILQLNCKDQKSYGCNQQDEKEMPKESQANLLKMLLTGEIEKTEVTKHEEQVIANRRISSDSLPQPQISLGSYPSLETDDIAYDTAQNLDLHLLDTETIDMGTLWSTSHDRKGMVSMELDEILQDQLVGQEHIRIN